MVQAQVVWSGVRSALEMRMRRRKRRRIAKCSRSCSPFTGSSDLAWGRRVGMYLQDGELPGHRSQDKE